MWNDTDIPLAYLITFRCYGTWLHGDRRGSIDRFHNRYKSPYVEANARWHHHNVTQGDPTGLNLGCPLVWLDFENAGHNAIFGEFANFCWDTYVFGGYFSPEIQPALDTRSCCDLEIHLA